jgi:hypothetical protein
MGFSRQNNTLKRLPKRLLSLDPAPASLNSPPYIPGLPSAVYLIHLLRTFIEQVYRIGFLGTHFWTAFCCFKILLPGRASTSPIGFPAYTPGQPSAPYLIHLPGTLLTRSIVVASPHTFLDCLLLFT